MYLASVCVTYFLSRQARVDSCGLGGKTVKLHRWPWRISHCLVILDTCRDGGFHELKTSRVYHSSTYKPLRNDGRRPRCLLYSMVAWCSETEIRRHEYSSYLGVLDRLRSPSILKILEVVLQICSFHGRFAYLLLFPHRWRLCSTDFTDFLKLIGILNLEINCTQAKKTPS